MSTNARTALTESTTSALEGLRYLLQPGLVRDLLALVGVGAILGGPVITLMPVFARERLGLGAGGYGTLLSALGIGGVIGALLLAGPLSQTRRGRLLTVVALAYPTLLLALAASSRYWLALTVLPLLGMSLILFNSLANGMLQLLVDNAYRGRLMALYSLIIIGLSQGVGSLGAGALARLIGVERALGLGGIGLLGYAGVVLWGRPEIRRA